MWTELCEVGRFGPALAHLMQSDLRAAASPPSVLRDSPRRVTVCLLAWQEDRPARGVQHLINAQLHADHDRRLAFGQLLVIPVDRCILKTEIEILTAGVKVKSLSRVRLLATPWTVAYQAPLSMDFPGKSTGVDCHFLLQGNPPDPGIEPRSPSL